MELYIHDNVTGKLAKFVPLIEDPNYQGPKKDYVWIYSCWPTVYNTATIGNLRTFQLSDLIKNVIKHIMGYPVKHVMNLTDVGHLVGDGDNGEDRMEKWSKREGISARDIAQRYTDEFMEHMSLLNNVDIDHYPKATDHIRQQIDMVKKLTKKWLTYVIAWDGIYFDTAKIDDYGKLLPAWHLEGLQSWARVEDHGKKNATDFALWKFSPTDETRQMEWIYDGSRSWELLTHDNRSTLTQEEQVTRGFPGWHIECSAMATEYLWTNFDIHTGGMDLKTTHHTNEICQSEHSVCCDSAHKEWVKYWIHGQFITVGWQKMGKSLGNAYTLTDLINKWIDPLDLRYFYFTAHYSNFQDFTWEAVGAARKTRQKLQKKLLGHEPAFQYKSRKELTVNVSTDAWKELLSSVENALSKDLNMPQVLATINKSLHQPNEEIYTIIDYLETFVLKCGLFDLQASDDEDIPQDIIDLAEARILAKKEKDYTRADALRDEITSAGYEIHDTADWYSIEKNNA